MAYLKSLFEGASKALQTLFSNIKGNLVIKVTWELYKNHHGVIEMNEDEWQFTMCKIMDK